MPTEDEYRREYEDFTGTDEAFDEFMLLYEETGAGDDLDTWFEFLNTFYPDVEPHDKEYWMELREAFYDYSGVTGESIDWELWRSIVETITPGGAK
jgi:hypothetical protein